MPAPLEDSPNLRFDAFTLDLRAGELYKSGRKIKLQEQPFRILALLLEQPGQVVTREQLRERLWPEDTFVDFDHSLNTAVKKLRQALNDEVDKPRFIETLPKRGYRFVGPAVETLPPPQRANAPTAGSAVHKAADERGTGSTITSAESRSHAIRWKFAALLLIGAAAMVSGIFYWFHRAPLLTEKDSIVLADFANSTGDAVFDSTLRQGLAVQLEQSPFLSLVSDDRIGQTLRLMGLPDDSHLTQKLAREVCQRANATVEIDGSIARLANEYVVGLNALNCQSGDTIAQEQITAEDKSHILSALGRAAKELREKLGESLRTIQKFDASIEAATTPSLEALKAYSLGIKTVHEKGEMAALPFFKRAIELDPNFAAGYSRLAGVYDTLEEPGLAGENAQKAYELRDRVSEYEKLDITTAYYFNGRGDLETTGQQCALRMKTYPRDSVPHEVLGLIYEFLGQYQKAVEETREAIRLNPGNALLYSDLMEDYTSLGRLAEARAAYNQAVERKLDNAFLHTDLYVVAFLENDSAEMQNQISLATGMPGAEDWLFSLQSDTAAFSGRLAVARELSRRAVESARRSDTPETAALWEMNAALRDAELGNSERARQEAKEGLAPASNQNTEMLAALVLARGGDATRAKNMSDDLEKRFPSNSAFKYYWLPSIRAAIELDRRNPTEAIRLLEVAMPYEFGYPQPQIEGGSFIYPAYLRGQAFLLLHRGTEAAREFQKFPDHRGAVVNCPFGALAHLWLGRAHALEGNADAARKSYQKFFTLWKDADPDIPILRAAKTEFAKLP
jgi:eukaryotic-like serine/threonine-protein kinase